MQRSLQNSIFGAGLGLALSLWAYTATAASFSIDFSTATLNGTATGYGFYSPSGDPTSSLIFDAKEVTSATGESLLELTHTFVSNVDIIGADYYYRNRYLQSDLTDDTFGIEFKEITGTSLFDLVFWLRFEFAADTVDSFMNAKAGDVFSVSVFAEEYYRDYFGPTQYFGTANTSLEITTLEAFTTIPLPGGATAMLGGLVLLGATVARRQKT